MLVFAVGSCLAYGLLLVAVWLLQDHLVFPAAGRPARAIDVAGVEELRLPGLDGARFRAAVVLPPAPRAVVAFFVGNGEDLTSAARRAVEVAAHGVAVVTAEYPGYGASEGRPSVESLMRVADVVAAHAEAMATARGIPFVVAGSSMGTFCALHVAAAGRAGRALLLAPPTSLVEAAAGRFWWAPVGLLLQHAFDNVAVAPQVRCPVLIVHGDQDRIVPLVLGQRLCSLLGGPAELVVVPGAGHNDLSVAIGSPVGTRVGAFLRGS
ncbi:MAG: alpha/beta hydrolase [Planctomycetes bacterium]|nr:alpha/beta hydrolase [Planctomycetota bacterium]